MTAIVRVDNINTPDMKLLVGLNPTQRREAIGFRRFVR